MSQSSVVSTNDPAQAGTANIIYFLQIFGALIPIYPPIGAILAYVNKGIAPAWLQSHYHMQIRTFWIWVVFFVVSVLTSYIFIGWIIMLLLIIWVTVRCIKGLLATFAGAPYENPDTWLW